MAKEDVLRFLPEEVINKYFPPTDDARYIKAKRKTIRIPDAREKFWQDMSRHKGRMRNAT
jgi:hypothetical protein